MPGGQKPGPKKPGTVSDDTLTRRGTPRRMHASTTLKVVTMLLLNTAVGVVCVGSGLRARGAGAV
jgi:hypothetical protein